MNKKQQVLTELFQIAQEADNFIFHNELVKQVARKYKFGNPFDVTKLDDTSKFPPVMLESDYFLLHLGDGRHQFVKGIANGFHTFETIATKHHQRWSYQKSILNESDTSESNVLSVARNQGLIEDFLYGEQYADFNVYLPRRTKATFSYNVGDTFVEMSAVQMEIDMTTEYQGMVTVFEAKNNFPENFATYQLYHPYLYYFYLKQNKNLPITSINCCYILRKQVKEMSIVRMYLYTFESPLDMSSIRLLKAKEYDLIQQA